MNLVLVEVDVDSWHLQDILLRFEYKKNYALQFHTVFSYPARIHDHKLNDSYIVHFRFNGRLVT